MSRNYTAHSGGAGKTLNPETLNKIVAQGTAREEKAAERSASRFEEEATNAEIEQERIKDPSLKSMLLSGASFIPFGLIVAFLVVMIII